MKKYIELRTKFFCSVQPWACYYLRSKRKKLDYGYNQGPEISNTQTNPSKTFSFTLNISFIQFLTGLVRALFFNSHLFILKICIVIS